MGLCAVNTAVYNERERQSKGWAHNRQYLGGDCAVLRVSSVGCRTHKWFVFSLQDSVEPDLNGLGCARLLLRVVFL